MANEVSFDELGRIRIYSADAFAETEKLKDGCAAIDEGLGNTLQTLQSVFAQISAKSRLLERQKLKVIGLRTRLGAEAAGAEEKSETLADLKQKLALRQVELDRYANKDKSRFISQRPVSKPHS